MGKLKTTKWMNSSMAERWLVKPMVESSSLSSSSKTPTVAILSVVEVPVGGLIKIVSAAKLKSRSRL